MGPLSAVAVAVGFFLWGLVTGGWATISPKVLGVIFIIIAVLVLIDAFWARSGPRWSTWRNGQRQPAA